MNTTTTRRALLLAAFAFCSLARAGYPESPVRLVIPFPPGSASDAIARAIATSAAPKIGQAIVVDNKAGGDGIISAADPRASRSSSQESHLDITSY